MDAKEFELPLEGSFSNLINQCFQQQEKRVVQPVKSPKTESTEKIKKKHKTKRYLKNK